MGWNKYGKFVNKFRECCKLRPNIDILDIGIGTGLASIFLTKNLKKICTIIGIEPSEEMIVMAKDNFKKEGLEKVIKITKGTEEVITFTDATFDLTVSMFALRHMKIEKALQEIKRVLKPRGRIVIADICAPEKWRAGLGKVISSTAKFIISRKKKYKEENKSHVLTVKKWRELFSKCAFKIDRIVEFPSKRAPKWKPKRVILSMV